MDRKSWQIRGAGLGLILTAALGGTVAAGAPPSPRSWSCFSGLR